MMKTEDLIGILAADSVPPPMLRPKRIAGLVLVVMAVAVTLFLWSFGIRDSVAQAMMQPQVAAKTLLPLALCAIALPFALVQMRPGAAQVVRLRWLAVPLGVAAGLWLWAFVTLPPEARFVEVSPFSLTECLGLISGLSLLPLGVLLLMMRRGASAAPMRAGAMAGLGVAGGIAAGYSLFCVMDNPLFYVTWYGVAIAAITALGAVAGGWLLRW
ncbi:MAG: DUF1109 domain-containing protein [Rhodobacter sp.]|nr:DUF1109 domain-containing protein [Rhodobacter sp.]